MACTLEVTYYLESGLKEGVGLIASVQGSTKLGDGILGSCAREVTTVLRISPFLLRRVHKDYRILMHVIESGSLEELWMSVVRSILCTDGVLLGATRRPVALEIMEEYILYFVAASPGRLAFELVNRDLIWRDV